jgi:type III secretion protein J
MTRLRVAALALLAALALAGCKAELYGDLSEREANEVVAALLGAGIPASKVTVRGGAVAVEVDEVRFAEAMAVLRERGLPGETYQSLGDVFAKEGIVSSPVEERARFIYAMSQELGQTIGEIDGVLSARVHVVLPETDMLGRDFKPSSASVFIRHRAEVEIDPFMSQIKMLVANSLEGLIYDNVTVVTVPALVRAEGGVRPTEMVPVLGLWMHPGSVARFWALLGAMGAALALAAGMAAWPLLRGRAARAGVGAKDELDAV